MPTIHENLQLAGQLFSQGRLNEADALGRQIVAEQPANATALNLLGLIARQAGNIETAVDFFRRAISANAKEPSFRLNLALLQSDVGRHDEAMLCAKQAVGIAPKSAEAHNILGVLLRRVGNIEEAIESFRRAAALGPRFADPHFNLGAALQDKLQFEQATSAYQRAIAIRPEYPEALNNLGNVLQLLGRYEPAITAYRKAIALRGDLADAHCNLGLALQHEGRIEEASDSFRRAIACRPQYAQPYYSLAVIHFDNGNYQQAIDMFRRTIQIHPGFAEAHGNMGNALLRIGQVSEAIESFRRSNAIRPDPAVAGSVPFAVQFLWEYDAAKIGEEHERWNRQFVYPMGGPSIAHENDRWASRPIRIGYVSAEFRAHPVGRFMLPLLVNHDRASFEVYCYSDVVAPDELTEQCRAAATVWRETAMHSDEQLAQIVRMDRIDILVDLTMHVAGSRLLAFARKPAPVQVSYLAYSSSSGLKAIDYRLTDPYLDPPGGPPAWYTEESVRLPRTYWCYAPLNAAPPVGPLPASANGYVTFGSFNNYSKVSRQALQTWAQLLERVANSRLIVHGAPGMHRSRARDVLRANAVDPRRLTFVPTLAAGSYFEQYNQIDIALDPFPYAGGTTTCDALWMGVPVVSLARDNGVSRSGLSILSNVGLAELVADSPQRYAEIAALLAENLPRLTELRATLRERMRASPLMDAPAFARDVEQAFAGIWERWRSKDAGTS